MPKRGRQPAISDIAELGKMLAIVGGDVARPISRLALRLMALIAVRPGELRGTVWADFKDLDGEAPLWRIPAARMKGDCDRKDEIGGGHFVPLAPQRGAVLRAAWKSSGQGRLVFQPWPSQGAQRHQPHVLPPEGLPTPRHTL